MAPRAAVLRIGLVGLVALFSSCGTKSGLTVPRGRGPDGGRVDGGRPMPLPDGGGGLPDGARPDARACAAPCDDGLLCNGSEYCEETTGTCMPGLLPDCEDGDECTVDTCDVDRNACLHEARDRDEDADGVGACRGDCDDMRPDVYPGAIESCDMVDQDCDGTADEGLLSECRDCRPGCRIVDMPREVEWSPTDENSAGVELAPDGTLQLSMTRTEFSFAWIANTALATITKLDTRDGTQAAEYDSALLDGTNGAAPPGERCQTTARGGNCPSRTAVDLRGAVYVANRAFFGQGTVTKIAGFEEDCIDRNGNGAIDTSRDLDADGIIERARGEMIGQRDECILWTVDVGESNGVPRAIAIAADGTVWVGLHEANSALQLDASTGETLRAVRLPSFSPYGAAIASDGTLWMTEAATGRIISVDTRTGSVGGTRVARSRDGCSGSYGIAIDQRDRVWLAGFTCHNAFRYDPRTNTWLDVSLPMSGAGRGIAADDRGFIYMGASHEYIRILGGIFEIGPSISRVTRFRADDGGDVRVIGTPASPLPGLATIGVGLDSLRRVWIVNQESGTATRVDFEGGVPRDYDVGVEPYTYSDFTGFALRTFTAPNGFLRTVVEGCAVGPTAWERVTWDATLMGGEVAVRVRSASTEAGLRTAPWVGPFETTPAELTLPPGPIAPLRYLEVEVSLVSGPGMSSPRIRSVSVQLNCPV